MNITKSGQTNSEKNKPKALKKFGLFGYEIGGWGSSLAFLLAVVGLAWQMWGYFLGPDARVLPMKAVEFACSKQDGILCEQDANLIVVADRLTIANYGNEGYDTSVNPGDIELVFYGEDKIRLKSIKLVAQFFTKRTQVEFKQEPASNIYLKAGTLIDFEVAYYPRMLVERDGKVDRSSFVKFNDFRSVIANGIDGKRVASLKVVVKPRAIGRNWSELLHECEIVVDDRMRKTVSDPEVGTFPRDCFVDV